MSTVRENILANIKTTLQSVTVANGYNNTLASVQRWRQGGNNTANIPYVIIAAIDEESKKPGPSPYVECSLPVLIIIGTRQAEDDTTDTETLLNSLLGDVEKALMVDTYRGTYAQYTNILGNISFEAVEGQPDVGIIIKCEIVYYHLQTDPETKG